MIAAELITQDMRRAQARIEAIKDRIKLAKRHEGADAIGDLYRRLNAAERWRAYEIRKAINEHNERQRVDGAEPGTVRTGGRDLALTRVAGMRGARTYAIAIWSLDIPEGLKQIAATYAGHIEWIEAGGQSRPFAIEGVDGGGSAPDPVLGLIGAQRAVDRAREAVDPLPGLSALRSHTAGQRRAITARAMLDGLAIEGLSVSQVLARHGWTRNSRNQKAARDLIETALLAVQGAWAPEVSIRGGLLWLDADASVTREGWQDPDAWQGQEPEAVVEAVAQ